ncbi:MAG: lipoprotein transporter ATP-binding protein [Deltaproteobacteria bacterium]|nr:lipoprotein transporter ATP-binding protein [Deltaproteobacteria bacterium]
MSDHVIEASGIKKTFQKDGVVIDVLKGVDLTADKGSFITIMGPSGAGKSTFLHIIGTLDRPTEGTVLFEGQDIMKFNEDEQSRFRNERVGFIFQFYHLLQDFNVIENIMMPLLIRRVRPEEARKKAKGFLETVELTHRSNHKPGELSGGEQQRVAIARALINEPSVILADEPTGNLDRKTGREVLHQILTIQKNLSAALILVTHDPEIGALGDRELMMVDGLFDS